jgi:ribulose-phosphate 3-epimerase
MIYIAPSILACNFNKLEEEIKIVEKGKADILHLDIMDGHFVPNITFGPGIIKGIRKITNLVLDAHLMISQPYKWIERFVEVGVDWISFHIEAEEKVYETIELVKKFNKKVGVAINPYTPVEKIQPWLNYLDFVVIMTVNPGFGGQSFIESPLEKIKQLKNTPVQIEVDGGIKLHNLAKVLKAGAHIIVSGSGIFNTSSPLNTLQAFREVIQNVVEV